MAAVIRLRPRSAHPVTGACLCGNLRYEIEGNFASMSHCHCSMCRKHHGTPFATYVSTPIAGFRWVAGEGALVHYRSSPFGIRAFCGVCGSVAPVLDFETGLALVPAGSLAGKLEVASQAHVFVASKASWHAISDHLPQHAEF